MVGRLEIQRCPRTSKCGGRSGWNAPDLLQPVEVEYWADLAAFLRRHGAGASEAYDVVCERDRESYGDK